MFCNHTCHTHIIIIILLVVRAISRGCGLGGRILLPLLVGVVVGGAWGLPVCTGRTCEERCGCGLTGNDTPLVPRAYDNSIHWQFATLIFVR